MISIGIYIGRNSFCMAGLSFEKTEARVQFVREHFFETEDSEEEKSLLISRKIGEIQEKYKGQNIRFCYGLSQNMVTSIPLDFPFKEKFKILKTLPFEIEDKSPFRSERVFFDARICKISKDNKSSSLCFVTPEEHVKKFLDFNKKLKNPPWLLSCEGSALANLLESWNQALSRVQNPDKTSFYIFLGAQNSLVLYYKKGYLSHISVLDWSVQSIIKEMKKMYKLSKEQVWEEFFEKAFVLTSAKGWTKEQMFFSNLIKKQLEHLVSRIFLIKMALEAEQKTHINRAMIFGPGAVIKNLPTFLTERISVPVSRIRKLKPLGNFSMKQSPFVYEALGLGLEGLKSSPYPGLNFLQFSKKESLAVYLKKWKTLSGTLLLAFLIFTAYAFIRKKESAELLDQEQIVFFEYGKRVALLPEDQIRAETMESFLEKEKSKLRSEELIQSQLNKPSPMKILQTISQKLGSAEKWNLHITYLQIKKGRVHIQGSLNADSLKAFRSELQDLAQKRIKEEPFLEVPESKDKEGGEEGQESPQKDKAETLEKEPPQNRSSFSYSFQMKKEYQK